jgi:hypothetical protein
MSSERKDIGAILREGKVAEEALELAFQDAVRQHRMYNLPVAVRKGGEIVRVSPFEIHLPEDDDPTFPKFVLPKKEDG